MKNRKLALFLAVIILIGLIPAAPAEASNTGIRTPQEYAAYKRSLTRPLFNSCIIAPMSNVAQGLISNNYIAFFVDRYSGRYAMGFTGGNPDHPYDDNKNILYGHPNGSTSATYIRLNDDMFFFTAENTVFNENELKTTSTMTRIVSGGAIIIDQTLQILENKVPGRKDTVKVSYTITNQTYEPVSASVRVMMDTQLGSNDGAPIVIPGSGGTPGRSILTQWQFNGSEIPETWNLVDAVENTSVIVDCSIYKPGDIRPDIFQVANWGGISGYTGWLYPVSNGSSWGYDNAVVYYWNDLSVLGQGTVSVGTYLGVSSEIATGPSPTPTVTPTPTATPPGGGDHDYYPTPTPDTTPRPTLQPTATPAPTQIVQEYIDPLIPANLQPIISPEEALDILERAVQSFVEENRSSDLGDDYLLLFSESAISRAAGTEFEGNRVNLNLAAISGLQDVSLYMRDEVRNIYSENDFVANRYLNASVKFYTEELERLHIVLEPSLFSMLVDNVIVSTSEYDIILTTEFLRNTIGIHPLEITINFAEQGVRLASAGYDPDALRYANENAGAKTISVSFNREINTPMNIAVKTTEGNPERQAFMDSSNRAVGGNYNPATEMMVGRISSGGEYTVRTNTVDFSDILTKSAEMQNAIRSLASKGIVGGVSATNNNFNPDTPVSRGEITMWLSRVLNILDPNANGGFVDVTPSDWFFGSVGSVSRRGLMQGTSSRNNNFSPAINLSKEQIITLVGKVLREEMRYFYPSNPQTYLNMYADANALASWSRSDVALATRENLVVYRTDGLFDPGTTVTRGEIAVIFYRTFKKIW